MSDHAIDPSLSAVPAVAPEVHHDDPMSHVPPPSLWPFLVMIGILLIRPTGLFGSEEVRRV